MNVTLYFMLQVAFRKAKYMLLILESPWRISGGSASPPSASRSTCWGWPRCDSEADRGWGGTHSSGGQGQPQWCSIPFPRSTSSGYGFVKRAPKPGIHRGLSRACEGVRVKSHRAHSPWLQTLEIMWRSYNRCLVLVCFSCCLPVLYCLWASEVCPSSAVQSLSILSQHSVGIYDI